MFFDLIWFWFHLLNCIKQIPYTNENTSNTIEAIKKQSPGLIGPQHKTTGQGTSHRVCDNQ